MLISVLKIFYIILYKFKFDIFFNTKSVFNFENWYFAIPYLKIILNLSNELTIEMDFLQVH